MTASEENRTRASQRSAALCFALRSGLRRAGSQRCIGRKRTPWARRLRGAHRNERGQAVFVVVLFFFLLAGLLFLILNTGEKLNHKVQMQNAADAVAATGAAWYARGLNVISMCNVAETQLLSMIVLLDTLETVTPPAEECVGDLVNHIGSSKAGHDIPIDSRVSSWLVVGNAASEQVIIRQFADIVRGISWPQYLAYDNGVLWECMKLLDGFSHAMVKAAPLAAQREALDIAKKNHADFGFVTPLWPELPVVVGRFSDFRNPMQHARMPSPDDRHVIGGFAWVMAYRGYHNQIMGPWSWWREPFTSSRPMGLFDISRFSTLFRIVSERKLAMLFGDTDDKVSLRDWEMDYDTAKDLPPEEIRRAWWEQTSFDARYPFPEPSFFSNMALRNPTQPNIRAFSRSDMSRPDLSQYTRAKEAYEGADPRLAVWYRVQKRRTAHYPQLGIFAPHPPIYPDGTPWPYTDAEMQDYYHVALVRFDGAELEADETLHRNYMPPAGALPSFAPILFNAAGGSNRVADIGAHFTFNGFAYRSGAVREWADRFANPNPIEDLVAYAQARVYNRWSWDLFTQYWKVKLMRTDRWADLPAELAKGLPAEAGSDLAAEFTEERLDPVRKMLNAYKPEFVQEVSH